MLLPFALLILLLLIGLTWLATLHSKHGIRVFWSVLILLSGCFASTQAGIYIGAALRKSDFDGPRRALGGVFLQTKKEIESGDIVTAKARITKLSDDWYSVDFFDREKADGRIFWTEFITALENIKTEANQSSETTTMAVTPAASHPSRQP